jgi:hypothetical protein
MKKEQSQRQVMTIQITCSECGSGIHVYPSLKSKTAKCDVCEHLTPISFDSNHEDGVLENCPCCSRKDFYSQKDFNRKIGVILFVLAAIIAIFTYGISLIVLYIFDLILFRRLGNIAVCYNCQTIFRKVNNVENIGPFNHEMNDRILYSGHDFEGKSLDH